MGTSLEPDRRTWVFGYGSLIWRPDFPFLDAREAWIDGWARRLWQGSHDHRGVPEAPGRVLTLVAAPGRRCAGRAFLVEHDVFEHLDHREKNGYERVRLTLHLAGDERVPGVVYRAAEGNPAWLGPAPLDDIAEEIARRSGPSGSNREYVLELARALEALGIEDAHVEALALRLRGAWPAQRERA